MESGRRWADEDIPKSEWDLAHFVWFPAAELYGVQRIEYLDDVLVLSGAGVGGGSHVYASAMYVPRKQFFDAKEWASITDWATSWRRTSTRPRGCSASSATRIGKRRRPRHSAGRERHRQRGDPQHWFYRAVVLAAPLSVAALIAGWVVTEVGRQPWVVYRTMSTAAAVTGAHGIPVGYGVLTASYVVVAGALVWVLRRLARAPLGLGSEPSGAGASSGPQLEAA